MDSRNPGHVIDLPQRSWKKNHTKTFYNRTVPINSEAVRLLKLIQGASQSQKWVFARAGERTDLSTGGIRFRGVFEGIWGTDEILP